MALNEKIASFGLARTNPKISGNVKITVDSSGAVWLNSIDSTKELSNSSLKKFRTTSTSTYAADLKKFAGKLPPDIMFAVKPGASPDAISKNLTDQYDLFYAMGAQALISDAYSEDYSYFAPLWMRDVLPDYFVIFRVNEPLDYPYNEGVDQLVTGKEYKVIGGSVKHGATTYTDGQAFTAINDSFTVIFGTPKVVLLDENKDLPLDYSGLFDDLVRRAEIVETFDLSENSQIGSYIRRLKADARFPVSPITVRFDDGLMTTWNGVSYRDGVLASKGERLDTFWSDAQTQIEFEETITGGFERNGVICPFLLNLEFLFDDESAPMYSIPRYFGFYVSKNETGSFQLSGDKLYANRSTSGNTPIHKRPNKGYKHQGEDYFQNNPDGVRLFYESPDGLIPDSTMFEPASFEPRFYWAQDRHGKFYSLDQRDISDYNVSETDLLLRNTSVNLGSFAGPKDVVARSRGDLLAEAGRSYLAIKVNGEMFPNDKIRLYWNIGTQTDANGKFDEITANDLRRYFTVSPGGTTLSIYGDFTAYYNVGDELGITYSNNRTKREITSAPVFGGTYTTFQIDSQINNTASDGYIDMSPGWGPGSALAASNYNPIYFHPFGTPAEIAAAIAEAFNSLEQRNFDAIAMGDTCVIRMRSASAATNSFFAMADMTIYDRITIQERVPSSGVRYPFEGGTDRANVRLRVPFADTQKLRAGEVYVKSRLGLSKIVHVGRYVDEAIQEQGGSELSDLGGFDNYAVVTIEDVLDVPVVGSTKEYVAYSLYRVPVGIFSVFNIRDIDGDFWSSDYNRSPEHEFKRYFNIPSGKSMLVAGREYYVLGDGAIEHDGNPVTSNSSFVATVADFTVTSGTPFVVAKIFFCRAYSQSELLYEGTYEVLGDSVLDEIEFYNNVNPLPPFTPQYVSTEIAGSTFTILSNGVGSFKVTAGAPTVVKVPASINSEIDSVDPDLRSFPGFAKFKDFLTIDDENLDKSTVSFKLNDKFFFNDLDSEYDYLKENFNRDLSVKSRLSQTVAKWVYQGGTDVRDNPYRLNTHPVFGPYNFAPAMDIKVQNPEGFTHEWYYIEGRPNQYPSDFDADNYYFFPDRLDLPRLLDADPALDDYFTDYFTFQPTGSSPLQERYSIFDYNPETGLCETFFRGAKLRIKEVVRESLAPELRTNKPNFKDQSRKYDGYKFTALLRPIRETRNVLESPVTVRVIENATNRSITFLVDVLVQDYRALPLIDPSNMGQQSVVQYSVTDSGFGTRTYIENQINTSSSMFLVGTSTDFADVTQIQIDANNAWTGMPSPVSAAFLAPITVGNAMDVFVANALGGAVAGPKAGNGRYQITNISGPTTTPESGTVSVMVYDVTFLSGTGSYGAVNNVTSADTGYGSDNLRDYLGVSHGTLNPLTYDLQYPPSGLDAYDAHLDYTLLYSMKGKKSESIFLDNGSLLIKGLDCHEFGDVKLSVNLNLGTPSGTIGARSYVNAIDNPDYDWDLRDEIKNFHPVNFMYGDFRYGDFHFDAPVSVTQTQSIFDTADRDAAYSFGFPGVFVAPATVDENGSPVSTNVIGVPYGSSYEWNKAPVYINEGGNLYYEPVMQRISFARLAERVNEYSKYVKYESYAWDESIGDTVRTDNAFYLDVVKPTIIEKRNSLIPLPDDDKPEELSTEPVIGTVLDRVESIQRMARFSGPYEPKFRNVLHFSNQITDAIQVSPQVDLSYLQATFNPAVPGFGYLKNFGYLKVANSDVLALSDNKKYPPRYPLLNETAIDRLDFPVYLSNWDPGFWRKFVNKSTYVPQAGTREMQEQKSFMSTKVMKTPKQIALQTFTVSEVSDVSTVDVNNLPSEITYSYTTNAAQVTRVTGYVDVRSRLIRYLVEDGASGEFVKYLMPEFGVGDPDGLDDDVVAYLSLNVVPTFEVKLVRPHVKLYKDDAALPIVDGTLDDAEKLQSRYVQVKEFTTNKVSDFLYRFEYAVPDGQNVSIALSFDMGKI